MMRPAWRTMEWVQNARRRCATDSRVIFMRDNYESLTVQWGDKSFQTFYSEEEFKSGLSRR